MNTTSKKLLSYLASATALVVLFASAGNLIGQDKATPRPKEIKPAAKKRTMSASYTPITVKREFQTPAPSMVNGMLVRATPRLRAVAGETVTYTFVIADFKDCPFVQVTTECREIATFDSNNGYSITTGANPKVAVFQGENGLVDSQLFQIYPGTMVTTTVTFPNDSSGKMFVIGITGTGEDPNGGEPKFAGGDIVSVE